MIGWITLTDVRDRALTCSICWLPAALRRKATPMTTQGRVCAGRRKGLRGEATGPGHHDYHRSQGVRGLHSELEEPRRL